MSAHWNPVTGKGLIDPAALDELIDTYEHKVGPERRTGCRQSVEDPEYKRRLMENATAAIAELAFRNTGRRHAGRGEHADVHNVTVCTLCSPATLAGSGAAACVVQISALSFTYRHRPARRSRRVRSHSRKQRDPRLGQQRRAALIWSCQNVRRGPTAGAKRS